ncbi:hypothetical protein RFI_03047 [Reticulomyxa filosa]|uniref:Uncharacterized protein n=1 Tax=Reticulomyxa filosa TaxID=46433 RepID=X6P761_RETFI|nr:hypothetical protein RFI_03047 [Reticulomyxa filosa]|eukprot:ETO34046.1 hypothetical protein RFI_03047 [Reticulomyxa filosa]
MSKGAVLFKNMEYDDFYQSKLAADIAIILFPITFIIITCLYVVSLQRFYFTKKSEEDTPAPKIYQRIITVFIVALTSNYIFCTGQYVVYGIFPLVGDQGWNVSCWVRQWTMVPLFIGRYLCYVFYLLRLYASFMDSNLLVPLKLIIGVMDKIPAGVLYSMYWALFQDIFWALVFTSLFIFKLVQTINLATANETNKSTPLLASVGSDHYVELEPSFLNPNTSLTKQISKENSVQRMLTNIRKQTRLTKTRTSRLMYLIFKLTNLCIVGVLVSSICVGVVYYYIAPLALVIEVVISSICMALSFRHFDAQYRRICLVCRILSKEIYFLKEAGLNEDLDGGLE